MQSGDTSTFDGRAERPICKLRLAGVAMYLKVRPGRLLGSCAIGSQNCPLATIYT